MTTRETIAWIPVELEQPPKRVEVLGDFRGDEMHDDVQVAFWDGESWRTLDGAHIEAPTHWAAMPTGARPNQNTKSGRQT